MKLKDLFENEFMDLSLKSRFRPEDDTSGIQSIENKRKPVITLRHVNKLKRMKLAQQAEQDKRKQLLAIMYGIPSEEEEGV